MAGVPQQLLLCFALPSNAKVILSGKKLPQVTRHFFFVRSRFPIFMFYGKQDTKKKTNEQRILFLCPRRGTKEKCYYFCFIARNSCILYIIVSSLFCVCLFVSYYFNYSQYFKTKLFRSFLFWWFFFHVRTFFLFWLFIVK